MCFLALLPALLAAPATQPPPVTAEDPHHQFDFWIGEWSVLNRHIGPNGAWAEGDTTRARITPVCGGNAILEEWAVPYHGTFMNGFSLRAYDPARKDWELLLFWTTNGRSSFGRMRGSFRHGRGEFFSGGEGQSAYAACYNASRPHQSLNGNAPTPRAIESVGEVVATPMLGGLHHRYSRAA